MSVPKAHVTPKLKSLPGGLRKQAEAIIKKKFELVVKKKTTTRVDMSDAKLGWDMVALAQIAQKPELFKQEYDSVLPPWDEPRRTPEYRVVEIRYDYLSIKFDVYIRCFTCGKINRNILDHHAVYDGVRVRISCLCGQGNAYISQRDLRAAMEGRF